MPIQGFKLTTEDSTFDLPDPPDGYVDQSQADDYVTDDELDTYESV